MLFLIKKSGLQFGTSESFNEIMKQVNIEDIGCQIGDCIRLYKEDETEEKRNDVLARLDVLVADYNSVMNTTLTSKKVLANNAELY